MGVLFFHLLFFKFPVITYGPNSQGFGRGVAMSLRIQTSPPSAPSTRINSECLALLHVTYSFPKSWMLNGGWHPCRRCRYYLRRSRMYSIAARWSVKTRPLTIQYDIVSSFHELFPQGLTSNDESQPLSHR